MRPSFLVSLAFASFLIGCAQQGTIVRKDSSPQPFYQSVGIDGSYAFLLRDTAGAVHRQLVTPEVFERYAVGDYFNDLQPAPAGREIFDGKTTLTAQQTVALPATPRLTKARKTAKSSRITKRKSKTRRHLARRTRRAPARKVVRLRRAPRVVAAQPAPILLVSNARCR